MISVIVPVYNTEKYLSRCIDSILAQTYTDFELILVDDGSTDGSAAILDAYMERDHRVSVFHQTNSGVSRARSYGVSKARGEWITFVDSDDYIPTDALEGYMELADDTTDIIIGWMNAFQIPDKIIDIEEYRRRCISGANIQVGPPTHTFRRTILSEKAFDFPRKIKKGEDMLMNIFLSFQTEKQVKVLQRIAYYYDTTVLTSAIHTVRTSMDYEELVHQYRLKVIPVDMHDKYMKESVGNRFYSMIRYIKEHPFESKWRHSTFYKTLMADIEMCRFGMSRSHKVLLYSSIPLFRWLVIIYIHLRFDARKNLL